MNYIVILDELRNEFINYYHFLQFKEAENAIDDIDDISESFMEDDVELDDEIIDSDYDDYILEEWNRYVNGDWDTDYAVFYNIDKDTSNMIKQMVMVHLYEFVSSNYNLANEKEKEIYDLLVSDLCSSNAILLYDTYYKYVLETYSYYMHDSISVNNFRMKILDNNLIDNVVHISPASLLDYRMLLGMKFEDEDISSVRMGKILIEIVNQAIMMYDKKRFDSIYDAIKYIIDDSIYINVYINSNWEYMLANYYEHLLLKNSYIKEEKQFIDLYENDIQKLYMKFYDTDDYREMLIYNFYILNRDKFSENYLHDLRCHTEKCGKDKILALKISPYYIEEQSYFKNKY